MQIPETHGILPLHCISIQQPDSALNRNFPLDIVKDLGGQIWDP